MSSVQAFLSGRLASLRYAGSGIWRLLREEKNARIHAVAAVLVLVLAAWLEPSRSEWAILALTIASVFAAEAANSALERLADVVSPETHPGVGAAKDLAAASVLFVALGAVGVAIAVLWPALWTRLR
jgi:diacylglycerol kinase